MNLDACDTGFQAGLRFKKVKLVLRFRKVDLDLKHRKLNLDLQTAIVED